MKARLRVAALLLAVAAAALPASAEDATGRLTGAPGSWVALMRDGEVVETWFWIGPEAIQVMPEGRALDYGPLPNQDMLRDRGLLPQRLLSPPLLVADGFTYTRAAPDFGAMDEPVEVGVETFRFAPMTGERTRVRPMETTFLWQEEKSRNLPGGEVIAYQYQARNLPVFDRMAPDVAGRAQRVYLPAFDVDIPARLWDDLDDIVYGAGLAASPELAVELWVRTRPESAECLTALRGTEAWRDHVAGFAALEGRTADLVRQGKTDLMEFGMRAYLELAQRTGVPASFERCVVN